MNEQSETVSLGQTDFWTEKVAIVLMAHNKCGLPIVRELLTRGMHVVGFTRVMRNGEALRQHLNQEQSRRYITREMDMHSLVHMRSEVETLIRTMKNVHLVIILIPKIKAHEQKNLYSYEQAQVLQAMLEIDELSAGALIYYLHQNLLDPNMGRCWVLRYNHRNCDLVCQYINEQLKLGKRSKREISIFLSN